EAVDQAKRGGLATARRADEHGELTGVHGEIEVLQRETPVRVALRYVLESDQGVEDRAAGTRARPLYPRSDAWPARERRVARRAAPRRTSPRPAAGLRRRRLGGLAVGG